MQITKNLRSYFLNYPTDEYQLVEYHHQAKPHRGFNLVAGNYSIIEFYTQAT